MALQQKIVVTTLLLLSLISIIGRNTKNDPKELSLPAQEAREEYRRSGDDGDQVQLSRRSQVTRSCLWVSKVPSCSAGADLRADSSEVGLTATYILSTTQSQEFKCPPSNGAFTKHPNPDDCGKFFLCISGIPRDQTCVAGLVFSYGNVV